MSRIIITGGAGFIGSQLGYRLHSEGHEVILIDDMSFGHKDNLVVNGSTFGKFIKEDVRSKEVYEIFRGADYVFHFAGISSLPVCQQNPYHAFDVNVGGTVNVLNAARKNNIKRVIFASTSAIYENNTIFPSTEDDIVKPNLIYATTKLQAEFACRSFYETFGLDTVSVRYYNVYGPHQDFRRLSPPLTGYVLKELLSERQPILHSTGEQKRDYVYVDDVNDLNILCMTHESAPGNIFNAASNKAYSVKEIYWNIANTLNTDISPIYKSAHSFWDKYPELFEGSYPLDIERLEKEVNKFTLGSFEKARKLLGWEPKTSLEEGMKITTLYAKDLSDLDGIKL